MIFVRSMQSHDYESKKGTWNVTRKNFYENAWRIIKDLSTERNTDKNEKAHSIIHVALALACCMLYVYIRSVILALGVVRQRKKSKKRSKRKSFIASWELVTQQGSSLAYPEASRRLYEACSQESGNLAQHEYFSLAFLRLTF